MEVANRIYNLHLKIKPTERRHEKRMKVALTRKRIALILALLMLSAGSGIVYAAVLINSNTIRATQKITSPTRPIVAWLKKPSNALTGEEFSMIVNVTNPNSKPLAGWVFNITVIGSGIYPETGPLVSLAFVGGTGWMGGYTELYPYSSSGTNQIVYLAPYTYYPMILSSGETDWAFVGRSMTSGTLKWYVTLIPVPWQVPA